MHFNVVKRTINNNSFGIDKYFTCAKYFTFVNDYPEIKTKYDAFCVGKQIITQFSLLYQPSLFKEYFRSCVKSFAVKRE